MSKTKLTINITPFDTRKIKHHIFGCLAYQNIDLAFDLTGKVMETRSEQAITRLISLLRRQIGVFLLFNVHP